MQCHEKHEAFCHDSNRYHRQRYKEHLDVAEIIQVLRSHSNKIIEHEGGKQWVIPDR